MIKFQDLLAQKADIDQQAAGQLTPEDLAKRFASGQQEAETARAQQMNEVPGFGATDVPGGTPEQLNERFQAGQVAGEARRVGTMNDLLMKKKPSLNFNDLIL